MRGLTDFSHEKAISLKIYVGRSLGSPWGEENWYNGIYSLANGSADEKAPDGLVVCAGSIGSFIPPEQVTAFVDSFKPLPVVTIGMAVPGYPCVVSDGYRGMAELTNHIVTLHRFRRFAFIKGPPHSPEALDRHTAWRDTLLQHGIPARNLIEYEGDFSYGSGQLIASRFDSSARLPFDVVSCANDDMAIGFLSAMVSRGFSCPRDFALTGFDDIPDSGFLSPRLTTVRQALYDEAYAAGRLLLGLILGSPLPAEPSMPCVPVIRESCACPELSLAIQWSRARDLAPDGVPVDHRSAALEQLFEDGSIPPPLAGQARDVMAALCDSASLDLRRFTENPITLQTLAGWLDSTTSWEDYATHWHTILSIVSKAFLSSLADSRSRSYAEDIFINAFALLTRKSSERQARESTSLRNAIGLFHQLSVRLGSAEDEEQIVRELANSAPAFGLKRISLALHRPGIKPCGPPGDWNFYDDMVIRECVGESGACDTAFLPLVGRGQSYGYVALGSEDLDTIVHESLANLIAHTIEAMHMQHERGNAEGALRVSEERHREIAAAVPVMILETDALLNVAFANDLAKDGLGFEIAERPTSIKSFMAPPDRRRAEGLAVQLRECELIDNPEVRLMNDQERRYVPVVRVNAKRDPTGVLIGIRWYALDLVPYMRHEILPTPEFFRVHRISQKAQKIIELQLQGRRIRQIAEELGVAESTVKGHLTQIYNRLGVSGKGELLQLLKDERGVSLGYNAYVFSLLDQLLTIDEN